MQTWFVLAELVQSSHTLVDEGEVIGLQDLLGTFKGQDSSTGEHILGKSLAEQTMAAHTVVVLRQKVDVVVDSPGIPGRRDQGQPDTEGCPEGANCPGVTYGEMPQALEHA
jgi:hypothetical protein